METEARPEAAAALDDAPVAAAPKAPAPLPAKARSGGVLEWLTRRQSIKSALAASHQPDTSELAWLSRSRAFAELADRALDPVEPLRQGSGAPAALSLYRQSAWLALLGQQASPRGLPLADALAALSEDRLLFAAGGSAGLAHVRYLLLERASIDDALLPDEKIAEDAKSLRTFTYALLDAKLGPAQRVAELKAQRAVRLLLSTALITLLTILAVWGVRRMTTAPDLAANKPWKASSQFLPCYPAQHRCGEAHTDIFFHTNEENNPWLQIDLKAKTRFSRIEVVNRRDCCSDRAVPLVIEVSQDGEKWREIARQAASFREWETNVAPVEARYVRARSLKRTWLHLERFSLRER